MASPRSWSEQVVTTWREVRNPGSVEVSGFDLWRGSVGSVTALVLATNVVGIVAVLVSAYLIVPLPVVHGAGHVRALNAVVAAAYVVVALPLGTVVGTRRLSTVRPWLTTESAPGLDQRRAVLLAPVRLFLLEVVLWFGAAALFGVLDGHYSALLGFYVAWTVAITGISTGACAYLLAERALRPIAVKAMTGAALEDLAVPGVATRAVLAWALGSGQLLLAVTAIGVTVLSGQHVVAHQLAVAMAALGGIGIAVGVLAVSLAARATAAPLDAVTRGMEAVQAGRLDTRVAVYDGTQIGRLQQGFNDMVHGLGEREMLRRAFGTYVDPSVAEQILAHGIRPEGELVEVTIMFVDVRGFTAFAERTAPVDVLGALNRLFEQIVPVIHARGGRVDKFVGDGLMAVFGAPQRMEDHATQAVAAALDIVAQAGDGDLDFGIGLNSGPVVAGNVGGAGRLEFGVIGDAVNVAARVEAATRVTGDRVLVTDRTAELAAGCRARFQPRPLIEVKGKSEPLRLHAPLPA